MNTECRVRLVLTVVLLAFVWMGHPWAIKLCLTLSIIAWEAMSWILRKEKIV